MEVSFKFLELTELHNFEFNSTTILPIFFCEYKYWKTKKNTKKN